MFILKTNNIGYMSIQKTKNKFKNKWYVGSILGVSC